MTYSCVQAGTKRLIDDERQITRERHIHIHSSPKTKTKTKMQTRHPPQPNNLTHTPPRFLRRATPNKLDEFIIREPKEDEELESAIGAPVDGDTGTCVVFGVGIEEVVVVGTVH